MTDIDTSRETVERLTNLTSAPGTFEISQKQLIVMTHKRHPFMRCGEMADIDTSREAVEQLAKDCTTAASCLKDVNDTFQSGQAILNDASITLRALLDRAEAAEAGRARVKRIFRRNVKLRLAAEGERDAARAEAERLREICWALFHLGNDGTGLKNASWTGIRWIDGGELAEIWDEARDVLITLQENSHD
ncbi:MAG: hypothetical protein EP341_09630 [Sphingomonadales bacterium]|nr:MAG: hypothetical protein EP341_09630 [Sphingomonadales bacterium]